MRIVVSPIGEYIDVDDVSVGKSYPFDLGKHSCGGRAAFAAVSQHWLAISCRACGFRQLVPAQVAFPGIMADFFKHLKSLRIDNWNSLPAMLEARRLALDFRVSDGIGNPMPVQKEL